MSTTDWEARIFGRIEAAGSSFGQGELLPGYVVRVYDREKDGPILDSQHRHGDHGVFAVEHEAESYRDRIVAATIAAKRHEELERQIRGPRAADLGEEYKAKRDAEKAKASEANRRAREHQKACDQLVDEAAHPTILVECNPRGTGWKVLAAPALVDGTQGGDPRLLERAERRPPKKKGRKGKARALDEALDEAAARKRSEGPPVHDAAGKVLRRGSRVELPGHDLMAVVTNVVHDPTDGWILEVEGPEGEILRVSATECMRLDPEEQPADGWPDEAA